ncbi:isochorismate synthase [Vibrio hannami]|uniref:isochorismate synthase n=1 Tax=Vibrio hannami TaxID=2717094 RepID=UPI00241000A3|nr:isochorismate synthase [Vibrio hannami]MDG3087559.1 isochorismate synthase [Vibrio hannami]
MSQFHKAIVALAKKVEDCEARNCRLSQDIEVGADFSAIDWLEAQPHYPRFYWQSRDTREEVVALGKVHTFTEPAPAYAILADDQRVWGGRAYDSQDDRMPSYFFLPQIELSRFDQRWSIIVNIGDDTAPVIKALNQLASDVTKLPLINADIDSVNHLPELPGWTDMVNRALTSIEQGEFKKVVLARKTELLLNGAVSPAQLIKVSREQNSHSFHFLFAIDKESAFVGSTPERLYRRNGNELETEAVAGTIGRGSNAQKDLELANWLAQDKKNLQENQYVVDDIVERLTPHSMEIDAQKEANLIRLRKVQHLKKAIHAALKMGTNGVQLLSALQPTAAVAGLPREDAIEFIRNIEPFARGWYSGSLGFISHQKAEFCVAIRSALFTGNKVELYAGAGIVPGSNADYEWQELDRKMSTLLSLLTENPSIEVAS